MGERIPVIVLAGYLGAGKTTLLNHVLRRPGARVGVIVNDFGSINLDAGLVTGQVDEPVSVSGTCLCCIDDLHGIDPALEKLSALDLDAIVIEASGLADPVILSQMVRFSGVSRVRPGGVVDVIDASEHARTIDTGVLPPSRYGAATLVLVNKLELVPEPQRGERLARITARVREVNPWVPVITTPRGAVDPELLFDAEDRGAPEDELPLWEVTRDGDRERHEHVHAHSVSIPCRSGVGADDLLELLEDPPDGVYRMKGCLDVSVGRGTRTYLVNVVGRQVHIAAAPRALSAERCLVAVGAEFEESAVEQRMRAALDPAAASTSAGLQRLRRRLRLSA